MRNKTWKILVVECHDSQSTRYFIRNIRIVYVHSNSSVGQFGDPQIKVSYSFYRWVIYSDVRDKLVNIAVTMMEDHMFSFKHI